MTQSTNEFGDPIAFKMRAAATPQGAFVSGRKVVKVEARQVGHHEGSGRHRRRRRHRLAADLRRGQASQGHRPRAVSARLLQRRNAGRPLRPPPRAGRPPAHRAGRRRNPPRQPLLADRLVHPGHRRRPCRSRRISSSACRAARRPRRSTRWSRRRWMPRRRLRCCARRSPATPSRSTSTAAAATSKAWPIRRAPDAGDPYRVYAAAPRPLDRQGSHAT